MQVIGGDVDIPEPISSTNSQFTLQAGRDLLAALQPQDQPNSTAVNFNQVLASANSITDTLEISPVNQTLNADSTSSALYQTQDQLPSSAEYSSQILESANSAIAPGVLPVDQALNVDPTSSALFQAHLGALASSQVSATLADGALSVEKLTQLKVTGIDATAASGPFANGQSAQPDNLQSEIPRVEPVQATRYAAVTGAADSSGTYGTKLNPQIGVRMDLKV
jgi:hypothetical protein